jgi:cleavage and polyadenylation specificity factor subunit 1
MLPGESPGFIIKTAKSMPKFLPLCSEGVRGLSAFHTGGCKRGIVYVDVAGTVRVAQLPADVSFAETGWIVRKAMMGETVNSLAYFAPGNVYILSTTKNIPFELPKEDLPKDDEYFRSWTKEDIAFKPVAEQGYIKLLSPLTWTVISTYELEPDEVATTVQSLSLETSENSRDQKLLVSVGTSIIKGTDLPAKGAIHVLEVITVVPRPGEPESDKALKLASKEEVKGAVTALTGINGYLMASQGQKVMVRGLKEDSSMLPVAFFDLQVYVSVAKAMGGLWIFGDAVEGLWFGGFSVTLSARTSFGSH